MRYWYFTTLIILNIGFIACGEDPNVPQDTTDQGTIEISVDETYKPIIEQELHVFDSSYPNAHITPHYVSENESIKNLLSKKSRVAILSRDLTEEEKKYCLDNQIVPTSLDVARDAIAVIVNPSSPDSLLSLEQLAEILTGKYKNKYTVVFDNQGSSLVRQVVDTVLKGKPLGDNVFAAKSNPGVIEYVAQNPNSIGLIGLGYVYNPKDSIESFIRNVNVVALKDPKTGEYRRPYQAYVAMQSYPLTRHLYFINSESWQGLGSGFCNFLKNERGQLIFFYARMTPLRSNVVVRDAEVD